MNHTMIATQNCRNLNLFVNRGVMALMFFILLLSMTTRIVYARSDHKEGYNLLGFNKNVIEIDVVENPRKFSFDETPVFEDGFPAYGGEFITQGFIYPKGTLEMGEGVDADGNPQFPDLVIGTWFCRGWHVGDGARTTTGPVVITHQLFNFGEKFGAKTVTTDGIELADFGVPVKRAITGGTGRFKTARGEQVQVLEGLNQFETDQGALIGVKLRVSLKIHR